MVSTKEFAQIAVAQSDYNTKLFALDKVGKVWQYSFDAQRWYRLSDEAEE